MKFSFKNFQREDYARCALHDGAILGHDTGGGKGLALFILPALKVGFERGPEVRSLQPLAPVLIVAPGDLHKQVIDEGMEKFKARVTVIDSQDAFLKLSTVNPATGARELPPGYYLTSYTQLASNGVAEFPKLSPRTHDNMTLLGLGEVDAAEYHGARGSLFDKQYQRIHATPDMSGAQLEAAWQRERSAYFNYAAIKAEIDSIYDKLRHLHGARTNSVYSDLEPAQKEWIRNQMVTALYTQARANIGEAHWYSATSGGARVPASRTDASDRSDQSKFKIKCVYSPTLADYCQNAFAVVMVDEGVKMKGEDTIIGLGVRQMDPAYRYVLTATPIKNRLPDVFRLAWWATGGRAKAHARFPYPDDPGAREEFADEFLITERNLSKEEKSEANKRYVKRTPQVCNIHRLWKMFAPIILRRRKADFGEDVVKKVRHVVRAPLGRLQAEVYRFHLDAEYKDINGMPAIGAQLQALRVAAANPASHLLTYKPNKSASFYRSTHTYIPKLHSTLKLIHQVLERGEQVVVFSAFHDSLDALSARLEAAGVRHAKLDGRTSQKKRGLIAAQFKQGPPSTINSQPSTNSPAFPVLLAGVECMAEGHSFHLCNNVILMCYSWAYDKFEQGINRVHRLNSAKDVNVYPVICDGSIDRKLEAMIQEKGEAAELVLDGKLVTETSAEVNLAELLHTARTEFAAKGKSLKVVDEAELEKEWPPLRAALSLAVKAWAGAGGASVPASRPSFALPPVPPSTINSQPSTNSTLLAPHSALPLVPASRPSSQTQTQDPRPHPPSSTLLAPRSPLPQVVARHPRNPFLARFDKRLSDLPLFQLAAA